MAEAQENMEKRCVTMQVNGLSRDRLQHKFMNGNQFQGKFEQIPNLLNDENEEEGEGDVELSLDLSLNGRFGVDPERAKRLKRSSSIANFMPSGGGGGGDSNGRGFPIVSYAPLPRTCSLPVEPEEECRKRKELQSMRRMEAKRKRSEKLQNVRVVKDKVVLEEPSEQNGKLHNGLGSLRNNGYGNSLPSSQGSFGSQGTGSSGISDFGSQPIQGPGDNTEARTPTSVQSSEHEQKPVAIQPETTSIKPPIRATPSKETEAMLRNFMLTMPCVSTIGDGPNGKKIDGFLHRYKKGEEVSILCVCHAKSHSPAEFVKHAGGGDVEHPLKRIVVNPSPLLE